MFNINDKKELIMQNQIILNEMKKTIKIDEIDNIGNLLNRSWQLKKMSKQISNRKIDELYQTALKSGATGGKLLGAGGGGFLLLYVPKIHHEKFKKNFLIKWLFQSKLKTMDLK